MIFTEIYEDTNSNFFKNLRSCHGPKKLVTLVDFVLFAFVADFFVITVLIISSRHKSPFSCCEFAYYTKTSTMKQILKLSIPLFVILLISWFPSSSATVYNQTNALDRSSFTEPAKPSPFAGMTISDFLSLTPRKYKALTGKKLSLPQKLSLKLAQVKVKKDDEEEQED